MKFIKGRMYVNDEDYIMDDGTIGFVAGGVYPCTSNGLLHSDFSPDHDMRGAESDFREYIEPKDQEKITLVNDKEYEFDVVVDQTCKAIVKTLLVKGKEYRRNGDPYHNFEQGAIRTGKTREEVLNGFALKHEISIQDMRNDLIQGRLPKIETVEEKFNDLLIYLIIEKASILDRINNQKI